MSERFGKYELLQRIGVGGMAEVWVARTFGAEGFVKELVIKRILEQFNEDEEFVSMFINEARLASRLQHANIVQIFDFDQVEGVYYIAMEFIDGPDLRKVVATARRRSMAIPQTLAVHVGIEVLKGLHYAHTRQDRGQPLGIVHRDISPHNLLLSYAGEVKITDFGIAKVAALASATRTGMLKGKLTYMSPEQVRADAVDARADLYALGIVIWELLAGRRRYLDVGSEGELVAAVRRGEVPHLAEVAPDVDEELAGVVDRLLAPDPDERFGSAAEALTDLSAFAGATDGLEVADYLAKLLPGGAVREQRGLTAAAPAKGAVAAAVDAATVTIDPDDAEVPDASSGEETG
ncbi:MAG: serine/threonine protein kinase, partial [Deltaproteobacteria bacterium]|nr:serine/threonine protein kinase [Deltaproteobacteria bacterium]